jgi:double-stranded uracil-DNA glycosylase
VRPAAPAWRDGLAPVLNRNTRLLVLGSFPGEASLAAGQYYAHPRNLFWPFMAELLHEPELALWPYARRLRALQAAGLGLWDVYARCRRRGSLDSAIEEAVPNDLAALLRRLPRLHGIAHNGGESARAVRITSGLGVAVWRLPSTSPANAGQTRPAKLSAWAAVLAQAGVPLKPQAASGAVVVVDAAQRLKDHDGLGRIG